MKFYVVIILSFSVHFSFAQKINAESFNLLNSDYDELNPVLSSDGQTLFFTIANHPQNYGGKKDPGDIWFSVWSGTQWGAPMHAGSLLNDRLYNAVAGISADGTQLFLLSHYRSDGIADTQGISVSKKDGIHWTKPVNISIAYFQNKAAMTSGYMTPDAHVFIFSADTYGTRGVEDIYVSFCEDGVWTEPKNLGGQINTPFQELSPALSADGKTLYFSSNGRKGEGSFDVYSSSRLDDSWLRWSEPVNLGPRINTEGRELFYRPYAQYGMALFTTTKDSDGYGDVKVFHTDDPIIAMDSVHHKQPADTASMENAATNTAMIGIQGMVLDARTQQPVQATLNFISTHWKRELRISGMDGFFIQLPAAGTYNVEIEAAGYISAIDKLDITDQTKRTGMNFKLQPVEIGTTVNLKSVLFERSTAALLPESNSELDLVVSFLKSNPTIKIELTGHTDNRGLPNDNVKLSQQRVNRIRDYLVRKGIDAKRITGKGYGGQKPIASNETEETRKLNRRVEFTIKKF